jgi:ribonuclease I
VLLLLTVLPCLPSGDAARHGNQHGDSQPGDFTYYVLPLSWSPAFCLSSPAAEKCRAPTLLVAPVRCGVCG